MTVKAGDMVLIKPDLHDGEYYAVDQCRDWVNDGMDRCAGQLVHVTATSTSGNRFTIREWGGVYNVKMCVGKAVDNRIVRFE